MGPADRGPRVLVVDDEATSAMALARFPGRRRLRVTMAHDRLRALEAHGAGPADLLVTDMRMPRMGGAELVARPRASRSWW